MDIRVAVDTISGNSGLSVTVPAAIDALNRHRDLRVLLFGPAQRLVDATCDLPDSVLDRITICNVPNTETDTQPCPAALMTSIEALAHGRAHAVVSSSTARPLIQACELQLSRISQVSHPALMQRVSTPQKTVYVIDVGAHLQPSPLELLEFAYMGTEACRITSGIRYPRVGLISNAADIELAPEFVQTAHQLISQTTLNYYGLIQANEIFTDQIDVVVCDGWSGNVAVKAAQGSLIGLTEHLISEFKTNLLTRSLSLAVLPILKKMRTDLSPERYGGALLLGYSKNIVKAHTGASTSDFTSAIETAVRTVKFNLPTKIDRGLNSSLKLASLVATQAGNSPKEEYS